MITLSDDTVIHQLENPDAREGIRRRIILEKFIAARKAATETITEKTIAHPHVNVSTWTSYGVDGQLLVEDVVVHSRASIV